MRNLLIVGLIMLLGTEAFPSSQNVNVSVKGMVCSFCAQGIKKKFGAEDAVSEVVVNLDKYLVTLKLKEGKTLEDETITKLLTEAGYTVGKIERK